MPPVRECVIVAWPNGSLSTLPCRIVTPRPGRSKRSMVTVTTASLKKAMSSLRVLPGRPWRMSSVE
jgi:hypothetical protein